MVQGYIPEKAIDRERYKDYVGILTGELIFEHRKKLFNFSVSDLGEMEFLKECFKEYRKERNKKASYDLKLGKEVYLSTENVPRKLTELNDTVAIGPGEFALLTTFEKLTMPPNIVGFISLRFSYGIKGLINISGFHVDPGFRGRIVFSVYNAGPNYIVLRYKDPMFTIIFEKLKEEIKEGYTGLYQDLENISHDLITGLKGLPVSIRELETRMKSLETWNRVFLALMIPLFIAIMAILVSIALSSSIPSS